MLGGPRPSARLSREAAMTEATFAASRPDAPTRRPLLQTARRLFPRVGGGLAALLAIGYGVHWWLTGRFIESTDNAYVRADVVTISARISGYVAEVDVRDNQAVRRGDVLARIDAAPFRARVDQARASVAAAEADIAVETAAVATCDAQIAQQRSQVAQAEAEIAAADADLRRMSLEWERQRSLAERQVSSQQRMETAEADQKKATATLSAAQAALASQRARLKVLEAEQRGKAAARDKAQAALQQAQATLALAVIDLDSTALRAPVDGLIGQRVVRAGQYVDPGQPLLAVVPHDAYVVANFKETQLGRIAPGQVVTVEVDAFDGEALYGRVDSFAPASGAQFALLPPDNATGNFTKIVQRMPVRIRLDGGQRGAAALRPGLSVVAHVDTRGKAASHDR